MPDMGNRHRAGSAGWWLGRVSPCGGHVIDRPAMASQQHGQARIVRETVLRP